MPSAAGIPGSGEAIVGRVPAVDDYLAALDDVTRAAFEHIRDIALELAPEAGQAVSYGVAALTYEKKPLLGFLVSKQHLSLFPFSPQAVDAVRDRLEGFVPSKGTIRFTAARPIPDAVVRDLVAHRIAEITAGPRRR
jgi:uncharacterized protein YdhG (YjbR/CyaY superfamily)